MNRAYSILELKEVDDEKRVLTGIATTPSTDRMDDVVEPKGALFRLPLPFLWQHNRNAPIGNVTKATVKPTGIEVSVQLAKMEGNGPLKQIAEDAWAAIKAGVVRGLSIGFKPIESADIDGSWGKRFLKWEWIELSAVTIPANADATITTIKALDDAVRSGRGIKLVSAEEARKHAGGIKLLDV